MYKRQGELQQHTQYVNIHSTDPTHMAMYKLKSYTVHTVLEKFKPNDHLRIYQDTETALKW